MKKTIFMSTLLVGFSFAQTNLTPNQMMGASLDPMDVGSEFAQLANLKSQLITALQSLPPHIQRVALYRLRADRKEFSPGMIRYIQSQIEEAFHIQKRDVVSTPELKTTRITSTDTSFQMSNAVSDAEELWKLGRKMRIDAFIDGGLTKSKDGDILLTMKLIKQETADVVWSQTFVAGPNEDRAKPAQFEMTANLGWGYWDVNKYVYKESETKGGLVFYRYYADLGIQQVMNDQRTWFIGIHGGMGYLVDVPDDPEDTTFNNASSIPFASTGIQLTYVLKPKEDPMKGFNLGMYTGVRALIPNSLIQTEFGLISRPSSHLGFSLGLSYMPFHKEITSGLFGKNADISYMESISYDARIQAYLF